jgi:hypothetical protein
MQPFPPSFFFLTFVIQLSPIKVSPNTFFHLLTIGTTFPFMRVVMSMRQIPHF